MTASTCNLAFADPPPGDPALAPRAALSSPPSALRSTAATPYIVAYLKAAGLTEVHDAYPFPAFERWEGTKRYYLISARRSQIDSLSHPVDIDVLEPVTPAYRQTRNLCRGVPLSEAVALFVSDTLKRAES